MENLAVKPKAIYHISILSSAKSGGLIVLVFSVSHSVLSHNLMPNRWNFMKLTLYMYDHSGVTHMKFHDNVITWTGVIFEFYSNVGEFHNAVP